MNRISSRLSNKHQITVPKSVRDFLGINERDVMDFIIKDGKVEVVKGKDMIDCPFCTKNKEIDSDDCKICEGKKEIEAFTLENVASRFYEFFQWQPVRIQIDNTHSIGFPVFSIDSAEGVSDELNLYKDVFQLEAMRLGLANRKREELKDATLQKTILELFTHDASKKALERWFLSI